LTTCYYTISTIIVIILRFYINKRFIKVAVNKENMKCPICQKKIYLIEPDIVTPKANLAFHIRKAHHPELSLYEVMSRLE